MVELTEEEYEELRYSKVQFKNMSDIHEKYKKEMDMEINKLNHTIEKLKSSIITIQQERNSDKDKFSKSIDLLGGVDTTDMKNKPEWQIYYEKIRVLKGRLNNKSAQYWTDMITDMFYRMESKIKSGDVDSIYLSSKQKDIIDTALEKINLKVS